MRAGGRASLLSAAEQCAFITGLDGVGMTGLDLLVNVPDDAILTEARGINYSGQISAIGVISEPQSCVMLLAGWA
jgi:hypothetical protein